MAPIRRYLRITRYSVLECRIYLDDPALVDSWFLNARDPVLPRVVESVRPLVLPKLQEENERSKGKGKKASKGIKDVVVQDEFEVAIFLTEPSTRHSLLIKQKYFSEPKARLGSTSRKLTDPAIDQPVSLGARPSSPVVLREDENEDGDVVLQEISPAPAAEGAREAIRNERGLSDDLIGDLGREASMGTPEPHADDEDKKKLVISNSYDGFSIYGRILCLIVKRRQGTRERTDPDDAQAMMENWIRSTQLGPDDG